jgi:hypothetical protein
MNVENQNTAYYINEFSGILFCPTQLLLRYVHTSTKWLRLLNERILTANTDQD